MKKTKRIMAAAMAVLVTVTTLPVNAFAAETAFETAVEETVMETSAETEDESAAGAEAAFETAVETVAETDEMSYSEADTETAVTEESEESTESEAAEVVDETAAMEIAETTTETAAETETETEILLEVPEIRLTSLAAMDAALKADLTGVYSESSSYSFSSLEDFDVDRYMADLLANNSAENGNIHLFLDMKSPAEVITEDLDRNVDFQVAVAAWKLTTLDVAEEAGEAISTGGLSEEQYYETALLEMMDHSFKSGEASEILEESFSTDLYNNLGLCTDLAEGFEGKNIEALKEELKLMDLGIEQTGDFLEMFLDSFGDTMDAMDTLVSTCSNCYEFIQKYTAYQTLKKFCGTSMVSTLARMEAACPADNLAMKNAIKKVKALCEDEMAGQIYQKLLGVSLNSKIFLSVVASDVVTGTIAAAGGTLILVSQALAEGYANLAFNTDDTLKQYYLMSAYAKLLALVRKSVLSAESAVKANNTKDNARYYIDSLALYFTGIENGCDYAKKFADTLHDARFAYGKLSDNDYREFNDHCDSIKQSFKNAHDFLLTQMWESYFESDYPDLYEEYMVLQDRPGGVRTMVTKVQFVNAAVTWRLDSGVHYIQASVSPENATNKGIRYSSSSETVVSVTADGRCKPVGIGTAVITASAVDGSGASDTLTVTVSNTWTEFTNEDGSLKYRVINDDEVSVYALFSRESYTVPSMVVDATDGRYYTVTAVQGYAFSANSKGKLANVTLPDTIRVIESSAFRECKQLTEINLPASLEKIEPYAFYKCTKLSSVTLPEGLSEIGDHAFFDTVINSLELPDSLLTIGEYGFAYTSLESIRIPQHVLRVDKYAFYSNYSLKSVVFENCYAQIGEHCFDNCSNMEQLDLGENVTAIKAFAFSYCKALREVIIPNTVSNMGLDVFCKCESLESITAMTRNPYISSESGVLFNKNKTVLYWYPDAKPGTSYTVPETVTSLASQAFEDNRYLEEIVLPEGLQRIETQAFSRAQSLKSLLMPDTVEYTGLSICDECPNLARVRLSPLLTEIKGGSFYSCRALTSVEIPEESQIEKIEESAFRLCDLNSFAFPKELRTIGESAFSSNKNLQKVILPDSVHWVGKSAFSYCSSVTELHLPDGLETLRESSFNEIAVTSIVIPEGVTEIPKTCFANNDKLTSVTIPSSVKTIGDGAFHRDLNLASVKLRGNLPYIYSNAFYDAKNVKVYYPAFDTSYDAVIQTNNKYKAEALSWAIDPATAVDISKCAVTLSATTFTYNGKAQLPKVTVKYGGTAVEAANYSVTGKNNKNPGVATITIKGKNALKGSVQKTVTIRPAAPKIASAVNAVTGITVKWNRISNATGYIIYRNGKAVRTIINNSTVSYLDTGAKSNGTIYTYKVRSFKTSGGKKIGSADSAAFKALYLSRPTCTLTNTVKGKLTVKWNKNAKATGYQIKYTIGTVTKTTTIKKNTTITTNLAAAKGKDCKVYIRSYRTYGGKNYYSPWSAVKTLKIKK